MRGVLVLLPVLAAGCSGSNSTADPGGTHQRFVGEWMIDQPFHATYEASWYLFHDSGELEHLRDCAFGGQIPTGWVSDASEQVRCDFARSWSAPDADTLVITGACSDGRDRDIVLAFPADTTGNATGLVTIAVVEVGGEDGWLHAHFDWAWQRCAEQSCEPAFTDLACPSA